ncbi:MAG: hypothetical protein RIQ99_1946 [Pseudomonadota bacterium]|jgi:hypothetical protein
MAAGMTDQTPTASQTVPEAQPGPCARSQRASIAVLCEARQGTRQWQRVRLDDLSERGFRISNLMNSSPGIPISIRIPGMQLLSAHIRWQQGRTLGCEFTAPLHVAVFEHLSRVWRAE